MEDEGRGNARGGGEAPQESCCHTFFSRTFKSSTALMRRKFLASCLPRPAGQQGVSPSLGRLRRKERKIIMYFTPPARGNNYERVANNRTYASAATFQRLFSGRYTRVGPAVLSCLKHCETRYVKSPSVPPRSVCVFSPAACLLVPCWRAGVCRAVGRPPTAAQVELIQHLVRTSLSPPCTFADNSRVLKIFYNS